MITSVKQTYKSSMLINPHLEREMIKKCKRQKDWKRKVLSRKAHSYRKDLKRKAIIIKENSCHNILVSEVYTHTHTHTHTQIESSHVKHIHYK
jgi:hypothetical protein